MSVEHLNPLQDTNSNFRVGETSRWFARLLHPGGVYWMSSHRGGSIWPDVRLPYSPASNYFQQHYLERRHVEVIHRDPNIQDYVFFMRLAYGVTAIGSFCLLLWALFTRFGINAAFIYGSLILTSPLVFRQFEMFYTETALFVVFNLAAFLCLECNMSTYRKVAYCALLSAAALSAKLTGVMIAAALFTYVVCNGGNSERKPGFRIDVFVLLVLSFMILININAGSIDKFLDDYLAWNIYHYAAGHTTAVDDFSLLFRRIIKDTNYFVVPLFLIALLWLARTPKRQFAAVYVLGVVIVFIIWKFANSSFHLARNMASVYIGMSFIIALGVGDFLGRASRDAPRIRVGASTALALVFLISSFSLVYGMPSLSKTFFAEIRAPVRGCGDVAAIGLTSDELRVLRGTQTARIDDFPQVRGPVQVEPKEGVEVFSSLKKFLEYDCLIVRRAGLAMHITNYLAPMTYTLENRVSNLFFFEKKTKESE